MSSIAELETSIHQYDTQLAQVDETLKNCNNDAERESLDNLKCDLRELLELTRETLREQNGQPSSHCKKDDLSNEDDDGGCGGGGGGDIDDDPYAHEMALFMSEINSCDNKTELTDEGTSKRRSIDDESQQIDPNQFKDELNGLIGKKCSAPYAFPWGAKDYHNALVCGLVSDIDRVSRLNDIKVTVLFTNPVHRNMVPCPFYLDGDCRFDSDKCRFSHGECVSYTDLKDYKKPIFSLLDQVKHPVLAKQGDNIWYKGRVVSSNFDDKTCQIKFEHNKKEAKCDFHDILPIEEEKPFIASSDSESDDDDYEQMHRAHLIEKSLLTPVADQALGEWEKHTKGFGSKMLQKFGYIIGTGLGHNGEGIIVPISAQILPPGRSLDHCMELREQANGDKNLFSVERKLKQMKKKEERISVNAYEREKQKTDVFSFINDTVFANFPNTSGTAAAAAAVSAAGTIAAATASAKEALKRHKTDFKTHTTKTLNVESLKIGDDIRRMEKEIGKLQDALQRHKDGTPMSQQLNMQLNARNTELNHLRNSEKSLKKEQAFRKDKTKLTIF